MKRPEIPVEDLRRLLRCEPETGLLFWLPRTSDLFSDGAHTAEHTCAKWNSKNAGRLAFTARSSGGMEGRIFRRAYRAHRVIWALVHGEWPEEVDHINRDNTDNRLCNLRRCSHKQNLYNQSSTHGSTSRFLGVHWDRARGNWAAKISVAGKTIHLGRFHDELKAAAAYDKAAAHHFGEFANLNLEAVE